MVFGIQESKLRWFAVQFRSEPRSYLKTANINPGLAKLHWTTTALPYFDPGIILEILVQSTLPSDLSRNIVQSTPTVSQPLLRLFSIDQLKPVNGLLIQHAKTNRLQSAVNSSLPTEQQPASLPACFPSQLQLRGTGKRTTDR